MCNCSISGGLRTEGESGDWTPLPDRYIYGNYNLCENLITKNWYCIFCTHTMCEPGKGRWWDIWVGRQQNHNTIFTTSTKSNYSYTVCYISTSISEELAVSMFRLFFLDPPEDGSSKLLQNVLPICMVSYPWQRSPPHEHLWENVKSRIPCSQASAAILRSALTLLGTQYSHIPVFNTWFHTRYNIPLMWEFSCMVVHVIHFNPELLSVKVQWTPGNKVLSRDKWHLHALL